MQFHATELDGVLRIEIDPQRDSRGFFARTFCPDEFARAKITFVAAQMNLSRNVARHTLRGLHYRRPPFAEAKVVRAVRGRLYDVVVDLRKESPSFGKWTAVELDASGARALYIPEGCAHGFLTLEPDTDVLYLMGRPYAPGHDAGLRWNDPQLAIDWPARPLAISPQDETWPLIDRATFGH